jgi:hypothetical protein
VTGTQDFDIDVSDPGVAITYFGYNMYNVVDGFTPGDYQGNNQLPPETLEQLFVDSTSPGFDLHLESSGHNALNFGVDLSSSFTNDIDDETRPTGANTWDIGADEYSAGGNSPPSLNVDEPDGTGDTVTVGDNFTIQYDLADSDDVVTVDFYYDTDNSGLDGTLITGDCEDEPEATNGTCTWNTTGMTPGDYYVYGVTNDGT